MNGLTAAYIYPLGDKSDILNFWLYPDSGEISLGSGGGSAPHPSYGHSVKQLTGRLSPTFSYSLIFEGVSPTRHRAGGAQGLDGSTWTAHFAFKWFMRNVGPEGSGEYRDEAQQFVMCLWDGSKLVSLDKVKLTPMIVSRAKGTENLIRRFRADVQGEYIYPVQVDQGLFKKKRKPRRRGTVVVSALPADAAQREGQALIGNGLAGVVGAVAGVFAAAQNLWKASPLPATTPSSPSTNPFDSLRPPLVPSGRELPTSPRSTQVAGGTIPLWGSRGVGGDVASSRVSAETAGVGAVVGVALDGQSTAYGLGDPSGVFINGGEPRGAYGHPAETGVVWGQLGQPGMLGQPGILGQPGMLGQPGILGQPLIGQLGQPGILGTPTISYPNPGNRSGNQGVGGGGQSVDNSTPPSVLVAKKAY